MFFLNRALPISLNYIAKPEILKINQIRAFAARKGTREKARKKKVKVEIKKVEFIPHNLREKTVSKSNVSRRAKEHIDRHPSDNVWIAKYYTWPIYDFKDAVENHRETHHPEIYNAPESPLYAFIELDMTGPKKNKYVDPFSRLAKIPHAFDHGENRSVLVFCKTDELKEQADSAGATLVGDVDIIKKVERGEVVLPDFHYILAHPNILPELVCLKGLLKKNFPSLKNGTLGIEIGNMVKNFRTGIQYFALRDEYELDYGWIETPIGRLNMDKNELEENFKSLIEDVLSVRPKREGPFITRAMLKSPPSVEKFKINLDSLLGEGFTKDQYDSDSDSEETKKKS